MSDRPDTGLIVIVTDADGKTKTLDPNAVDPGDRPQGIQFSTQQGSGFYTGSFTLRWPIYRDRVDVNLGDEVRIIAANGDTRYEGFVTSMPRSMDADGHSLTVQLAGWMAHGSDRTFTAIFVDRDNSQWGPMSVGRRSGLISSVGTSDPQAGVDAAGTSAVRQVFVGTWAIAQRAEAWYDAGEGCKVSKLYYDFAAGANITVGVSAWDWYTQASDSDASNAETSSDLSTVGTSSSTYTPSVPRRYLILRLDRTVSGGADGTEAALVWTHLAAIGDHGLELIGSSTSTADVPLGVAASDVIRYTAGLCCPLLDTSGVQDTTYPISHLTFREDTKPYDAWLKVNSYHLWQLAVWENRTLHYEATDLADWDWEIRHDDVGNQIGLQGDSLENLRNGIVVQFTDVVTGKPRRVTPDDHDDLRDDSIDNPYNLHGRQGWGEPYQVPYPVTEDGAVQLGRTRLAEDNQPKAPGSFTVQGHLRDRSGNLQPVSKVRAGDRIRLTSSANLSDRPRLIHETQYSQDGLTATIAVDSTLRYLEGYVDRVQTALTAAGLS